MNKRPKTLQEICLLRLLLIVLLVLYHAFAPFYGSWTALPGQNEMDGMTAGAYKWIGMGAYAFMLETFTFISGYIFGYQVDRKGEDALSFGNVVVKKIKRLIVPSIVFSIVYVLVFRPAEFASPFDATKEILYGAGHMWYLPMLFWCFVGVLLLERIKLNVKVAIPLLAVMAIISYLPFPFRLNLAMYYMFFFFCGYLLTRMRFDVAKYSKPSIIGVFAVMFILAFVFLFPERLALTITPPRLV